MKILKFTLCSRCLAHDMEEDEDFFKNKVIKCGSALSNMGLEQFLKNRDQLWKRMDYRAFVSLQCCLQVRINYFSFKFINILDLLGKFYQHVSV